MADKKLASGGRVDDHYNSRCSSRGVASMPIPLASLVYMRRATLRDYLKLLWAWKFRTAVWLWRNRKYSGMLSAPDKNEMCKAIIGVATGPNTMLVGGDADKFKDRDLNEEVPVDDE